MKIKAEIFYTIRSPSGTKRCLHPIKSVCIDTFLRSWAPEHRIWRKFYREGFRCVKVKVEEIK